MMTVKELAEQLAKMPPHFFVRLESLERDFDHEGNFNGERASQAEADGVVQEAGFVLITAD